MTFEIICDTFLLRVQIKIFIMKIIEAQIVEFEMFYCSKCHN